MNSLVVPVIRAARPGDLGYVINTWENSMRHRYREAKRKDYAQSVRTALERSLHYGADLHVAEQDGVILGWMLTTPGAAVIYGYVRRRYRNYGVATALYNYAMGSTDEIRVRYMTDAVQQLIEAGKNIRYVPYI